MDSLYLIPLSVVIFAFVITVPLMLGVVKPNRWVGFRTPKTLKNEAVWYKANRFGGVAFFIAGIFVAGGQFALSSGYLAAYQEYIWAILLAPIVVAILAFFVYLQKL